MADPDPFEDLVQRVRSGDQDAAAELVKMYEPAIRRTIRFRLSDTRLQAAFDSMDVCQSVLASFFVRAAAGEYELESPDKLKGLLVTMAQKKLAKQTRRHRAQKRDQRRIVGDLQDNTDVPGAASTPSQQFAAKELLEQVHQKLTDEEREIMELRNQGLEWNEIALQLDGSAEALRKKFARAMNRITVELGIEEDDE
ncbi:MAG: RNA polymerase sigma factor [Gemmataceae bacterium]